MKKVRILAVGIGGYANIYLEELLNDPSPDFEFAGMVDVAAERCKYYPQLRALGVPLYDSMEAFYAADTADLAIITTPIHFHTRQILCALRHGSNVMCEKPLSGVSADEKALEDAIRETGKFVIIGYQWSYAPAILSLKQDVTDGKYGKAVFLKSRVFWPRAKEYYLRGSGWGGRRRTPGGDVINDSVASNATAHYLHNMLYVTGGARNRSSEPARVECDLLRVNEIENFDTCAARFTLEDGTPVLFLASHGTHNAYSPAFEYRFERGVIRYPDADGHILGELSDGTVRDYGDPFDDANRKIREAIAMSREPGYLPPCGVSAAAPQVRCIEMLQEHPIRDLAPDRLRTEERDGNHFRYAEGLEELLLKAYAEEKLPSEYPEYASFVR